MNLIERIDAATRADAPPSQSAPMTWQQRRATGLAGVYIVRREWEENLQIPRLLKWLEGADYADQRDIGAEAVQVLDDLQADIARMRDQIKKDYVDAAERKLQDRSREAWTSAPPVSRKRK